MADDHPAVLAGIAALVDAEPGLRAVAAVRDAFSVDDAVHAHRPDVVILDYQLPGMDGLSLARTITRRPAAPAVMIYSAFAGRDMLVPAHIAGAAAVIDKGVETDELASTITRVAAGERLLRPPTPELRRAAGHRLAPEDLPLLALLLDDPDARTAAEVLGLNAEGVERRVDRLLARLVIGHRAT